MNEEEELEQWKLIHVLSGELNKPGHCKLKCGDPTCGNGCLRQPANLYFRADIMHGVELVREEGGSRFPLVVPWIGGKEHCNSGYCHDPVCRVVGCMEAPGFNFRDLIKRAQQEKLWKVLKK